MGLLECVFLFGFAKNVRANISKDDVRDLAGFGGLILALNQDGLDKMLRAGELAEVQSDDKD